MPRTRARVFDEVAWLYDRARPGYPEAAIDVLVDLARLRRRSKVLEIGAGTGHLTLPLLRRGLDVTAVEPGARLAALLEKKLTAVGSGQVLHTRFEDLDLTPGSFDAVVAATAFHWIDPDRRCRLAARLLRPGGALGIIRNDHVLTSRNGAYYRAARRSYQRHAPEMGPPYLPPKASALPGLGTEIADSGLFRLVGERRLGWDRRYTTPQLTRLLRTYSGHRLMRPAARRALFEELRELLDGQLGGSFVDRYVTTVCVGEKVRRGARHS